MSRFDAVSRRLAGLRAGQATPGATPAFDSADPHPPADDAARDPEFLFVQPFTSGTWTAKEGEDGIYSLTLSGTAANTVYFSDRPNRIFGLAPIRQFLDNLGFTPENPPNAAIVAATSAGDEEVLVIELLNPVYDGITLTYDARILADYHDAGLAHAARRQDANTLPGSFGEGGLFIDDCPDGHVACIGNMTGDVYGQVNVGYCWSNLLTDGDIGCHPCHDPADYCLSGLPQFCRKTIVYDGVTSYANVCHAGPYR